MKRTIKTKSICILFALSFLTASMFTGIRVYADGEENKEELEEYDSYGGGYAVMDKLSGIGYTAQIYDATSGLDTSEAMCVMGASSGFVYVGGYGGVYRYDGSVFERLSAEDGLTSARAFYEDTKSRIWVGTNDNGVVLIDGEKRTHITYKEGLPSSSIRDFVEDAHGNMYVATTAGLCYIDSHLKVYSVGQEVLGTERILRLSEGVNGRIYGYTSSGLVFMADEHKLLKVYTSDDLEIKKITTIISDPANPDKVYLGTIDNKVYYGYFGDDVYKLECIDVSPLENIHWISYDCGSIWVSSKNGIGYLDEDNKFHLADNVPVISGIEMSSSDYQGNIWIASSTAGVVKVVANNFFSIAGRDKSLTVLTNSCCEHDGCLCIGTDEGLKILNKNGEEITNALTAFLLGTRIRCLEEDADKNLWIGTFSSEIGLVCYKRDGSFVTYNEDKGLPDNQIRSISNGRNGKILVCTTSGLAVMQKGVIIKTISKNAGILNTVFLAAQELDDGRILVGTDGDGLYIIDGYSVSKIGRDQGLTSDVIVEIIHDTRRKLYWIITSNSIQYYKDGVIKEITTFPYNNFYDMYFDDSNNAWLLASNGVYCVRVTDIIEDNIKDYMLYSVERGLPFAITPNPDGCFDYAGNLYIPGTKGIIAVNINNFYEHQSKVKVYVRSVMCGSEEIKLDEDGIYKLPASTERIQFNVSVIDYTMIDPVIHMYLENGPDDGMTGRRSKLSSLEYTNLPSGVYTLHVEVIDENTSEVIQDAAFDIVKKPRILELLVVRALIVLLIAVLAGIIAWKIMGATVIKRQYDEITKAKAEADNANNSKSRFLANMSHEIRTPINTIKGMNEMIMREDATDVPKNYFLAMMNYSYDIKNATESLLSLINDFLDISKIESGKMHVVEQEYDVTDAIRSIVSMVRVRSIEKELTFDVVVDEMLPKRLYGDIGKIKQITLNILTNAIKYTEKGGIMLNIFMEERHDDICLLHIAVKDTGIGVKEEDLDKLFSAYERLDEERNSAIQGTGLGLDISKRFAELMNGKLWCESEYGKGSEFILTLDQKIVDATPLGLFVEHEETASQGPYIPKFIAPDADVLVVDDNPMNLSVIKGLLKATKVFVTTSTSGEDAIDKIRNNHFDVVLLDHMMPGMDGIETLEHIRKMDKDIPVYALTANATAGEEFYVSKGFNGYLSKPIETEVLERTIMKHLPESMMEKPSKADAVEELTELPESKLWLNDVNEINVDDGIKFSGGISAYLYALELFVDTFDDNYKVISDSFDSESIRMFTIKVHALKSSARIIGARELSSLAEKLEKAGNDNDMNYIKEHTKEFLDSYTSIKNILAPIKEESVSDDGKEPIPEDELKDAYEALKELIPMMDYDAVEMILGQLKEYKLPKEDGELIGKLSRMLKGLEWDEMEQLINDKL